MELITKPRSTKQELNRDERYQYSYKVKNGKVVEFFGNEDVKKYFDILKQSDEKLKILFEHRSDLISASELEECYEWIESIAR